MSSSPRAIGAIATRGNTSDAPADLTIHWDRLWTIQGVRQLHDVWANQDVGDTSKPYVARGVASHDVALFRLSAPAK